MEYYERIKALRLKAGETQTQAAEAVGMTLRQFQRYEAGEQNRDSTISVPWPTILASRWIIWQAARTNPKNIFHSRSVIT